MSRKMKGFVFYVLFVFCCAVLETNAFSNHFEQLDGNPDVQRVHLIFMNHLDVGYAKLANDILNEYFGEYFHQAGVIARQLREGGYVETFSYLTHPWIVDLFLNCPPNLVLSGVRLKCPNVTQLEDFHQAVKDGDITWHAGPMNMQYENSMSAITRFGLNMSRRLDQRLDIQRKLRVLSLRDVPGMTIGMVPHLKAADISAVTVGVNMLTAPPAVPREFIWRYTDAQQKAHDMVVLYHPNGYPNNPGPSPAKPGGLSRKDCHVLAGFPDALCFVFRTDNSGPPKDIQEVLGNYEILRAEFPGAELFASTLEKFVSRVIDSGYVSKLPVVEREIGDTWINGISSDPDKVALTRLLHRNWEGLAAEGGMGDPRVMNASRFLLKLSEHTWGGDNLHPGDNRNWSNVDFDKARSHENYQALESSWSEQKQFFDLAMEALEDHPVVDDIKAQLADMKPDIPDLSGFEVVKNKTGDLQCCAGGQCFATLAFGPDGSIQRYSTPRTHGGSWGSESNPLGKFVYHTYNEGDFKRFEKVYAYSYNGPGIEKPNLDEFARPESRTWNTRLDAVYQKDCTFVGLMLMETEETYVKYGGPRVLYVTVTVQHQAEDNLLLEYVLVNKRATRLPEAGMLHFAPSPPSSQCFWEVSKLGTWVTPTQAVLNGSQVQHSFDQEGTRFNCSTQGALQIIPLEAGIAVPFSAKHAPTIFAELLEPFKEKPTGMAFNLFNNVWNTNYILWYPYEGMKAETNLKSRFLVRVL